MKRHIVVVTLLCGLSVVLVPACARQDSGGTSTAQAGGKILPIGDLTAPDVDALSRDKTLFLVTIGMLEVHGPHLPIATDTIEVENEVRGVAAILSRALPGWNVMVMPTVNYGSSGANQVGGRLAVHPGTYGIRQSTLRSLVADIGGQIAQNRFNWIYVMNGHGAPTHHIAVNEASDFVSETFGVTMLNVSGLFNADAAIQAQGAKIAATHFSTADVASFGMDAHAGVSETSAMLAVRPELVSPGYRTLPSLRAENFREAREIGLRSGWPVYLSSPAKATAAYGRDVEAWWSEGMADLILRSVRGESMAGRPRWPDPMLLDSVWVQAGKEVLEPEREFELKLERWLDQRQNK
jgi:creatinine amidohydrolase